MLNMCLMSNGKHRPLPEAERHAAILKFLSESQFASVNDIVDLLKVSPATVRRDFAKLHATEAARVVHGGIAPTERIEGGATLYRPYLENETINVAQKQAIGTAAAKLCSDGDTIFIHGGSTCSIFAKSLHKKSVRVFTNSFPVAAGIWENPRSSLNLLGGDLHREPAILYSPFPWTEEFFVSKYFMGALGIDRDGLLENDPLFVKIIDMVVRRANEVVVLADSSKFHVRPRLRALPFNRVTALITDDGIPERYAKQVEEHGVRLIIANATTTT